MNKIILKMTKCLLATLVVIATMSSITYTPVKAKSDTTVVTICNVEDTTGWLIETR
jgi:hypothetical protein